MGQGPGAAIPNRVAAHIESDQAAQVGGFCQGPSGTIAKVIVGEVECLQPVQRRFHKLGNVVVLKDVAWQGQVVQVGEPKGPKEGANSDVRVLERERTQSSQMWRTEY